MGIIIKNIALNAEAGKVWRFITLPKNFPKYVYGYADGRTISPNETGIGASYDWYGKLWLFKLRSTEEVVVWQERKIVAYTGRLFGIKFDSSMAVEEIKNKTRLTVDIKYKVPFYFGGAIIDLLLIRWLVKDYIGKSLQNLENKFNC